MRDPGVLVNLLWQVVVVDFWTADVCPLAVDGAAHPERGRSATAMTDCWRPPDLPARGHEIVPVGGPRLAEAIARGEAAGGSNSAWRTGPVAAGSVFEDAHYRRAPRNADLGPIGTYPTARWSAGGAFEDARYSPDTCRINGWRQDGRFQDGLSRLGGALSDAGRRRAGRCRGPSETGASAARLMGPIRAFSVGPRPNVLSARYWRFKDGDGAARKAVRDRGRFPTEQSALKVLYLVATERRSNQSNPTGQISGWKTIVNALTIHYGDGIEAAH